MPPNNDVPEPFDSSDEPASGSMLHGLPGDWPVGDDVGSSVTAAGYSAPDAFPADHTASNAEAGDTYWSISRRPLTSLVFSLPLVLAYEGGVLLLGRGSPRNGADVWLRTLLDHLGFGQYFLLPVLTVLGLLAWHHIEHDRPPTPPPRVACGCRATGAASPARSSSL